MAFNFGSTGGAPAFGAAGAGGFGASSAPAFGAAPAAGAAPNPFGAGAGSGAAPAFGGFGTAGASTAAGGFGTAMAKPSGAAFGAPAAPGVFGATSGAAPAFGAAGAAKPAFGATPAPGAVPALGAGAVGFGAGTASGTAPKPAFGATGATGGFGAASGAATGGGFGFGAAGAKPATGAGFGGGATGGGFGAGSGAGFGAGGGLGGGFGAMGAGTGAGTGAAGAIPNPFGASGGGFGAGTSAAGMGGTAAAGAGAGLPLPQQHHAEKGLENLVQPIEGMGNFLGSHVIDEIEVENAERRGQPVLSREAGEVFQAVNAQFIAWNPWDPALLTTNARLAAAGALRQAVAGGGTVEQRAQQLLQATPAEVERQLTLLPEEQQDMVKLGMMPRFDQQTLMGTQNNRNPPDLVENQWASCDWKPLVDNPHCRFRHYVLQPLTQAQMKLPPDQRHGLNQTASSSPNDPLFQSKLQENPNPYKYCVLPIVGFHQLLRRVRMQDDKLQEHNAVLQSFEQEVNRMREFQAVEFPKMLAQRKARQVELGRRTLEVLRRLEMQRQPGAGPSREVQALSDMGDQLRQALSSTLLQRRLQHLEEQMAQLRMQDRRRLKQRSVPSVACEAGSLERLDDFLEHRLRGVRHLLDLTRKDLADAHTIRQRLTPAQAY